MHPIRYPALISTLAAAVALAAGSAHAAPAAAAAAPATAASAAAPAAAVAITPAKQALVDQILKLWNIDNLGVTMLQAPVADAMQQARAVLQGRATGEKRDQAMSEIAAEAKKFMDENTPVARQAADRLIPTTIAPLLAERFSEEELQQLLAILQSPVKKKFEAMVPEMQKTLGEKIAADTGPVMNPKLQGLKERIGMRLRAAVTP
jgi:uncharacterized protein (DUF2342 family)